MPARISRCGTVGAIQGPTAMFSDAPSRSGAARSWIVGGVQSVLDMREASKRGFRIADNVCDTLTGTDFGSRNLSIGA